jgi:hypothetical protein
MSISGKLRSFISIFILILFLAGCESTSNSMKSSVYSEIIDDGTPREGVTYSIPKQDLILTIERKKVSKDSLANDVKEAEEAVNEQVKKVANIEQTLKLKKAMRDAASTQATKEKLTLEADLLVLELTFAKKKVKALQDVLKVAKTNLATFKEKLSPWLDKITLTASNPYPSSDKRFRARQNTNWISSETVEIKTTSDGLLSGGTTESVGQLDDIIVSTISAINALSGGGFQPFGLEKAQKSFTPDLGILNGNCPEPIEEKFVHRFSIDQNGWQRDLDQALSKTSFCYDIDLENPPTQSLDLTESTFDGLLYPVKRNFRFRVVHRNDGFVAMPSVVAIDPSILSFISLDKAYFATNSFEFEFDKGMLTRFKAVRPNGLVEFLKLPVDAAKAIVSIPTEILKLRVDYSSTEEAYLKAQKLVHEAQSELDTLQE